MLGKLAQCKHVLLLDSPAFLLDGMSISYAYSFSSYGAGGVPEPPELPRALAYREPVGDFLIDTVDALYSFIERLDGLRWLQVGLRGERMDGQLLTYSRLRLGRHGLVLARVSTHQHGRILGSGEVVHDSQLTGSRSQQKFRREPKSSRSSSQQRYSCSRSWVGCL
jgi:hypothetical protein